MYKIHTTCRSCGCKDLIPVFDLGIQPLANDFCHPNDEHSGQAPLSVLFCPKCTLAQLSVVVNPEVLYRNYNYVTSPSQTMRKHFSAIYNDIISECEKLNSVIEIGSNDGLLLETFKSICDCEVLGIEPAQNLALISNGNGIPTLNGFFNKESVQSIIKRKWDVILARHVFCHIDDWHGFISSMESIAQKDTLVCLEIPYVIDTLSNTEFDQCYHEHLSYPSVKSIQSLLVGTKLRLHRIIKYPIHGGAIMVMLRHVDFNSRQDESVKNFLDNENITCDTWRGFSSKANRNIARLHGLVEGLVLREGKTVAGIGASAKSTVWINASGIGKWLSFIADETPQKQGKFSPGSNIPILPESSILEKQPDYLILFAWNWKNEIISKNREYLERGGKFIVPVPSVEII